MLKEPTNCSWVCVGQQLAGCGKALWALLSFTGLPVREITGVHHAGCSKKPTSKAAASEEARRTLRYVEPLSAARTPHGKRRVSARRGRAGEKGDFFSILLARRSMPC